MVYRGQIRRSSSAAVLNEALVEAETQKLSFWAREQTTE